MEKNPQLLFFNFCLIAARFCRLALTLCPGGGGENAALDFHVDGGGAAGGRKIDPVAMRSVHKKYTLSQYTLLKMFILHTLSQYCTVAGARSRACHKHCGLGLSPGKQPCDKRSSPPVAN